MLFTENDTNQWVKKKSKMCQNNSLAPPTFIKGVLLCPFMKSWFCHLGCTRICFHACLFNKHILFHIFTILQHLSPQSDAVLWLVNFPVCCDWQRLTLFGKFVSEKKFCSSVISNQFEPNSDPDNVSKQMDCAKHISCTCFASKYFIKSAVHRSMLW